MTGLAIITPGIVPGANAVLNTVAIGGATIGGNALAVTGSATVSTTLSVTGHTTFEGVTSTGATGTGNIVYSASPTLTGTLTAAAANFSGQVASTLSGTGTGAAFYASSSLPAYGWNETDQSTDNKLWDIAAQNAIMRFRAIKDDQSSALEWMTVARTGIASAIVTISQPINYGGVTLSNAVTGTGNMVLSASPTPTGTLTGAAATFSGTVVMPSNSQVTAATISTVLTINQDGNGLPDLIAFTGKTSGGTAQRWDIGENVFGDGSFDLYDRTNSRSVATWNRTNGRLQMPQYGAGSATFDGSGNLTSVSDPSQKIITGAYTDGLAAVVAASSDEFMGWHKWRPESGMETEGTYASFFARDNFPIAGAVAKNGERPNSFNDRPVIMALVNAVAELKAEIETLKGIH